MAIPAWADGSVSELLPAIREGSEGQHAEFIVDFADQVREVAKEVAAMATSGGGKILLGVRDNGTVAGLNTDEHDKILHRAQGLVRSVQPPVCHKLYLCYDDGFILVIHVSEEQDEPLFFCEERPYVRDNRESRPARPHEVKERVWSHPSSEQKRRNEEFTHKMRQDAWEMSVKRTTEADAISAMSMIEHEAAISRSLENMQRTNEMARKSVMPKT